MHFGVSVIIDYNRYYAIDHCDHAGVVPAKSTAGSVWTSCKRVWFLLCPLELMSTASVVSLSLCFYVYPPPTPPPFSFFFFFFSSFLFLVLVPFSFFFSPFFFYLSFLQCWETWWFIVLFFGLILALHVMMRCSFRELHARTLHYYHACLKMTCMTLFSSSILTHIYKRLYGCLVLPRRCMPFMFPFGLEVENDLHLLCTNGFSLKIRYVSTFFLTDEDYFKLFIFGHG